MVIFYIFILVLMLLGIKFCKEGYFQDYIDKTQCNAIKGIFILVVFMRHVVPYVTKAGYEMPTLLDKSYSFVNGQIGQLLVVMFLFYSGFGVMTSISRKGENYINDIPKKRVLTTFLNFDVAVSLFLMVDFALGIQVDTQHYFFARFGWESVGNSNWYIFIIMVCYILTYFSFKQKRLGGAFLLVLMTLVVIAILHFIKKPHWYNTMMSYPAGMIYAIYKDRIETVIKKRYVMSILSLSLLFIVLHVSNSLSPKIVYAYTYNLESIVFAFLIVTLTMKVRIGNSALYWLGANLFPLYIYQRMPMIAMRELVGTEWMAANPYFFVVMSLAGMLLISSMYKYWKISL